MPGIYPASIFQPITDPSVLKFAEEPLSGLWGGYFCVFLLSFPNTYPNEKQVRPKASTFIKSITFMVHPPSQQIPIETFRFRGFIVLHKPSYGGPTAYHLGSTLLIILSKSNISNYLHFSYNLADLAFYNASFSLLPDSNIASIYTSNYATSLRVL